MTLSNPSSQRWSLPFYTTHPVTDLGGLFLLLPVWWVLGAEQFIWLLGVGAILLKIIVRQRFRLRLIPIANWLLLFLLVHLISGLFIVENERYITFVRNFSTYLTAWALLVVVVNSVQNWQQIRFLLMVVGVVLGIAGIVGLLGITKLWQPQFTSLVGQFLPEWIRNSSYGGEIAYRQTVSSAWFAGINYYRVKSFFLYATLYASALAIGIPVIWFLFHRATSGWQKGVSAGILLILLTNLLFTTGRIAILGFLLGGIYYLLFASRIRTPAKIGLLFILACAAISTAIMPDLLSTTIDNFLYARGEGSFTDRQFVYQQTLQGFWERPLFGWGTERRIPNSFYPTGSHSYYLGILYKQGLIGFLLFVTILFIIWRDSRPFYRQILPHHPLAQWLHYGRWSLIAALVNSTTDILDLDATTFVLWWLLISLLLVSRHILQSELGLVTLPNPTS